MVKAMALAMLLAAQQDQRDRAFPVPIKYDPVAVAWADCQKLDPAHRPYVRYVWSNPNLEPTMAERHETWQALSMACWRLSREQVIYQTAVAPVDAEFLVFRIDLLQLGWYDRREETWEKLVDPYMTYPLRLQADNILPAGVARPQIKGDKDGYVDTGEKIPAGIDSQGRQLFEREYNAQGQIVFKTRKVKVTEKQLKEVLTPFYSPAQHKLLADATQSRQPLMRSDWFWNQIQTDADKAVGYSAFLGIKDEADFDKAVGRFPEELRKNFLKEYVESTTKIEGAPQHENSPTHQPRLIEVESAAGGPYWRTSDNRLATGNRSPLSFVRLKGQVFQYEGRESLGHLPNGLLAAGAFAGNVDFDADVLGKKAKDKRVAQGTRADVAPDFLASDRFAPSTDRRIHVGMSCWRCHGTGIHDLVGFFRTNTQPPNAALFDNPKDQKEFIRLYQSDLEEQINLSRTIYANAILRATTLSGTDAQGKQVTVIKGLTTEQESSLVGKKWRKYENAKVDLNYAAADLMMTPGQALNAIKNIKTLTGKVDIVLDNFVSGNLPLTIRQWEEYHPLAKAVSLGVAPQ